MSPSDRAASTSGFDHANPVTASDQPALTHWRAVFDERLEALERALRGPVDAGDLSSLILDFARVAGEEAEAAAREAALDTQRQAPQATETSDSDRQALEAAHAALAEARRQHHDARQALDATRRAHEETRRAYDSVVHSLDEAQRALQEAHREAAEARQLATDAEGQAQQANEERRELVGIQTQLQEQLADARTQVEEAAAQRAAMQLELTEAEQAVEARGRELQTFRRRLEQAVQDAEERSRAQDAERVRLDQEVASATARAAAAASERDAARHALARAESDVANLRPQVDAAAVRIACLEQDLLERDRVIEALRHAQATAVARTMPERTADNAERTVEKTAASVTGPTDESKKDHGEAPPVAASLAAVELTPTVASAGQSWDAESVVSVERQEEAVQQSSSDEMPWLRTREASNTPAEPALVDAVSTEAEEREDGRSDDPPLSPESTGVFSTVADALRAWTSETSVPEAHAPAPTSRLGAASSAAGGPVDDSARQEAPQYDVVRQTVRHDLASRRIPVTLDHEPGQLVDLSGGGAQVITASMLKPGRQVRLSFPTAGPLASAKAKIVWSRLEPPAHGGGELQYRAGVTFLKIDAKTIERVVTALDRPARSSKRP